MSGYKHGVYTAEQATSLTVPVAGTSGLQVIFGTAPKASDPVLAYSYDEAVEALGYSDDWDTYTLCQSMKACFDLFNVAPVVFINAASEDDDEDVAASEVVAAIDKVREIYPRFGMTPGLLLAPGWSKEPTVAAKLQSACENINGVYTAECIIDVDDSTGHAVAYSGMGAAKTAQGITSAHAIAAWPHVKSGEQMFAPSAVVGALMAYTDAINDDVPNLSPSNRLLSGVTGICLADGTDVILDQDQANQVNAQGVVTFLNMNGFRCWGNNTAAFPASTDPKDRWIMVRRFFTWRRNSLIRTYFQKVDSPANYRLIESICDSENILGNSFVARGIVAGYKVSFRAAENPITQILNGKIVFHIDLAPYTPAEDIEFLLEFDPTAIETALTGGAN